MPTNGKTNLPVKPAQSSTSQSLREAVNRLFDEFGTGLSLRAPSFFEEPRMYFMPKVDIQESEKDVIVTAELPGMNASDIDVSLMGDNLLIKGEKKEEKEEKQAGYHRLERSYGSFERLIALPSEIQRDKIDANYKDGVLKLTLPKTQKAAENARKIDIKVQK